MIETELQYRITKEEAERFEKALADLKLKGVGHDEDPLMLQLWSDSFESVIDELHGQLAVYERSRSVRESPVNTAGDTRS